MTFLTKTDRPSSTLRISAFVAGALLVAAAMLPLWQAAAAVSA